MTELFQESGNDLPLFKDTELQSKFVLQNEILQSKDRLFLIKYTPQRTLRARWYLVQIYLASTSESNLNAKEQGIYYCILLDKHNYDQGKRDEFGRWWPEWYI